MRRTPPYEWHSSSDAMVDIGLAPWLRSPVELKYPMSTPFMGNRHSNLAQQVFPWAPAKPLTFTINISRIHLFSPFVFLGGIFGSLGPFLSKDFSSQFIEKNRAIFAFPYFPFFFPNIGMRSLPNILPSVEFPCFGNASCFSCFSCFAWKKRRKIGKSWSIRTALTPRSKISGGQKKHKIVNGRVRDNNK